MSPAELVTRLGGSSSSNQPPIRKTGRNLAVGSISTAQCRRMARTATSSSSRYLATSFFARAGICPVDGAFTPGSGQRADEGGDALRGVAESLAGAADELGRGLGRLDDVE